MKKLLLAVSVHCLMVITVFSQTDNPQCSDSMYRFFNKLEGFFIENCEQFEYKTLQFYVERNSRAVTKEGKYTKVSYRLSPTSTRKIVGKQIVDNYVNAVKKAKGEVVKDSDNMAFHLSKNGKSIWVSLSVSPYAGERTDYYIEMVEETVMKQELETSLQEAITEEGKAVFYGIHFDVGKAIVKPESQEAIQSIADYLAANPRTSIFIVGHTDNTGNYLTNIKLSKQRAAAVKTYLVTKFKTDAKRLFADGVGPLSPIASNGTEEGKKLNRRVEIVLK